MSSGLELRVGNKYRLGRKIGSGSFGDIYLGTSAERIPRLGTLRVLGRCVLRAGEIPPAFRPRPWRTRTRGPWTHRRRSFLSPSCRHAHSDRRGSWHQAGACRAHASPRGNPRGCSQLARVFFFSPRIRDAIARAARRDGDRRDTRLFTPPLHRSSSAVPAGRVIEKRGRWSLTTRSSRLWLSVSVLNFAEFAGIRQDETPAAFVRVEAVQDPAGRHGHPQRPVVRRRGRL